MKSLVLQKIIIENFKCFDHFEAEFSKKTIIDGRNAAGKTSIMDAFTWCLFGTDADGNTRFDIRPLNSDGKAVDNTVISVAIDVLIDGEMVCFKRSSRQNWVKKRGSDAQVFQGNIGEYEIDGYPCSEAEYSAAVAGIADQKVFKILTSATYFGTLPWKEQRDIVLSCVEIGTDRQVAEQIGGFGDILDELEKAPDTDAIKTKYAKKLRELKAKQSEIPTRIDEASKMLVDYDADELTAEHGRLEAEIAGLTARKVENDSTVMEAAIKAEIAALSARKREISSAAYAELNDRRAAIREELHECTVPGAMEREIDEAITGLKLDAVVLGRELKNHNNVIADCEAKIKSAKRVAKEASREKFDESAEVCPYCGRPYDPDDIAAHIKKFEEARAAKIESADAEVEAAQKKINSTQKKVTKIQKELDAIREKLAEHMERAEALRAARNSRESDLMEQLDAMPTVLEPSAEEIEIDGQIAKLTSDLDALTNNGNALLIEAEIADKNASLKAVSAKLAELDHNDAVCERIESLREELLSVGDKILQCEKVIYLIESFIREKMAYISELIDERFGGVHFKLFDVQINGGLKETCEISYAGIPYSELNSGHRIVAGLLVVNALQDAFDVMVPVWIDNAESVNESNLPEMRNQMVLLRVSENRGLTVIEG